MPVPRHAWWRGRGLTWRRPESLTIDGAGPAAPPILARHCRTLIRGAAEPNKTPAAAKASQWPSSRRCPSSAVRPPGRRARVRPRQPAAEHAGRHATNAGSPAPARPSIAASPPSLPFPGRLPPPSSSFKVMTYILFLFE